jgi:hypothetical protein
VNPHPDFLKKFRGPLYDAESASGPLASDEAADLLRDWDERSNELIIEPTLQHVICAGEEDPSSIWRQAAGDDGHLDDVVLAGAYVLLYCKGQIDPAGKRGSLISATAIARTKTGSEQLLH